jgi:hypothetical protein
MSKQVNRNTNTSFKFTAYTLVVALLFSLSTDALHFISHSDHIHCDDYSTTHFHKHEFECEIFDFKFSVAASFLVFEKQPLITNNYKLTENCYQFFYAQPSSNKNFKRGPPTV